MSSPSPLSLLADALGAKELNEVLTELVYQLPVDQRHTVLLKYPLDYRWKTYSDEQIGRMLRISSTWVRTLRKKAFVALRKKVEALDLGENTFGEFGSENALSG